jgi:hypothetical protein
MVAPVFIKSGRGHGRMGIAVLNPSELGVTRFVGASLLAIISGLG